MLNFKRLLEGQEATGTPSGNIDSGGSHFGELVLPQGHWCWQVLFWSPPSSLFWGLTSHQWMAPSTAPSQPSQPAIMGPSPTTSRMASALGLPGQYSQLCQDLALSTSSLSGKKDLAVNQVGASPHLPV